MEAKIMKKLALALALTFLPVSGALAQLLSQTSSTPTSDSVLISPETGVDFKPLQNLLADQRWREANDETLNLVLQATGREAQGWLSKENIQEFPCWDLKTIDSLWKESSNGRFGWSTQFPIFISSGNKPGRLVRQEAYEDFGDRIGWRKEGDWIVFKENLVYSLNAPEGHLPNLRAEYDLSGGRLNYTNLVERMVECALVSLPSTEPIGPTEFILPTDNDRDIR